MDSQYIEPNLTQILQIINFSSYVEITLSTISE